MQLKALPKSRSFVALITAVLSFCSGCARTEPTTEEAPAPVQVAVVTQDTMRRIVSGDGALFAQDQRPLTPKIASPVQKFYVNRGDHVRQGQLLAILENRDLIAAAAEAKSAVDQAESVFRTTQGATVPESVVKAQADVESARQAVDAAKKVLDSREQLVKEGAIARRLVDEAQVAYAQANSQFVSAQEHLKALQNVSREEQVKTAAAQVASARSHYQSLEAQVAYSQIISPISGVVADRPIYPGEMASPGTPLLTIMDITRIVARINVPQVQATSIRVGCNAEINVPDGGERVPGKVIVVSPATDSNSTTVQVWAQAENPGERLKPGTGVHVNIITEIVPNATVVPASSLLPTEDGGTAVLTVSSDSVAHKRLVQVGVRNGDKVQILSSVRPGEEVVTVGGYGLDDKAKVKRIATTVKEAPDEGTDATEPKDQKKDEARPRSK
jgi:multidrug efflux pump subunit AcrA (membrane-fusion protein)